MRFRRGRATRRAAAVALVCLVLAACTSGEDAADDPQPDCTPFKQATSVDELNQQIQTARSSPEFRGGDVGASVLLRDGRSLWIFGDTLRGPEYGNRIVRNSMLLFEKDCIRTIPGKDGGAIIPDRDDEVGYWPMSIAVVPKDGVELVGVMSQRVRNTGNASEAWGFETLGPSIAVFVVRPGQDPVLSLVQDFGPDDPARTNPAWGAASWIQDGYVYLYGTSNPGDGSAFGYALRVARVPIEQIVDQSAWTYWDGQQWQSDPAAAAVLIDAVGGVSQTLSVIFKDGKWYAVSKRDDFLGTDLVVWSADAPTGPFVPSDPVAKIPSDFNANLYLYMPLAHPELFPQPGSLVVSVSRNTDSLAKIEENPTLYRPEFMTITLPS